MTSEGKPLPPTGGDQRESAPALPTEDPAGTELVPRGVDPLHSGAVVPHLDEGAVAEGVVRDRGLPEEDVDWFAPLKFIQDALDHELEGVPFTDPKWKSIHRPPLPEGYSYLPSGLGVRFSDGGTVEILDDGRILALGTKGVTVVFPSAPKSGGQGEK